MGEFTVISVFGRGQRVKNWFCDQTGRIFVVGENGVIREIKFSGSCGEAEGSLDSELWKNQFVGSHFRKEYKFGGDDRGWLGRFGFQTIDLAGCEVVC